MATKRTGRTVVPTAGVAPASAPIEKTSAVLDDLLGATEKVVTEVEQRDRSAITAVNLANELTKLGEHLEEETKQVVEEGSTERLQKLMQATKDRILNANLSELLADFQREEGDLGEALAHLQAALSALDQQFVSLNEPPAEALELVRAAQAEVVAAQAAVAEAGAAWFFRGSKTQGANEALETAQAKLKESQEEARRMTKERLRKANFEQAFQSIQLMASRIANVINQGFQDTEARLKITAERRVIALQLKSQAAGALDKVRAQHTAVEDELRTAQEKLGGLVNNSPEYVAEETIVAELRAKVEDMAGRCSTALGVLQSKERFVLQHELFEKGLQKLRSNLRTMEAILRSDMEERDKTFAARLQLQKSAQLQEGGLLITELGREQDARNAAAGAAIAMQSDRAMTKLAESQSDDMARLAATVAGFEEAHAAVRARMHQIFRDTAARYGLDESAEHYLSYADK